MSYQERIRELEEMEKHLIATHDNLAASSMNAKIHGLKEGYALRAEELIKAVTEYPCMRIKDLPYFDRMWAGSENGKLMPEETRKVYMMEIMEKLKVLELLKDGKG